MADDLTHFHGLTKEVWSERLNAYHEKLRQSGEIEGYGAGPLIDITGWDAWEGYFRDGYSPEAALDEDRTYWGDD